MPSFKSVNALSINTQALGGIHPQPLGWVNGGKQPIMAFVSSPSTTQARLNGADSRSDMREVIGLPRMQGLNGRRLVMEPSASFGTLTLREHNDDIEPQADSEPKEENGIDLSDRGGPIQRYVDEVMGTVKKTIECLEKISDRGSAQLESVNPFQFLSGIAEKRAGIDERHNPTIKTALLVAAMKSAAGALPDDKVTPRLVGPKLMFAISLLVKSMPTLFKELGVTSRTPWLDSRIEAIIADQAIEQIVMLGAGLDTRAQRMPSLAGVKLYELDLPEMIEAKESLFEQVVAEDGESLPEYPTLTRIKSDLSTSQWMEDLKAAGFDAEQPTLFIMEGVIYYFDSADAQQLGSQIRALSSDGSHLLFDCINEASIEQSQLDKWIGKPAMFNSGIDHPETWLQEAGFDESVILQPGEEGAHFGLFDDNEMEKRGFHRTHFGTYDRFVHKLPRDEEAPDGKAVKRFFFAEGIVNQPADDGKVVDVNSVADRKPSDQ